MDFPFDINQLFADRISVLDQNLTVARKAWGRPDTHNQIATVIDELGKASAKAQQLATPITSAAKMQSNRHHLYLLKDREGNGGRGMAVGFLKVGYKKLFLLNHRGAHLETEPLCVLDFYISESLQRHGYGKEIFNYMLECERVEPQQMAFDRPSPKFQSFLKKHYSLEHCVPQVNNFVVFDGFFREKSVVQVRKLPPRKPEGEIKPYSLSEREALREEQRTLPWPFSRATLSPPPSSSSSMNRSLSVGSSPSHGPPRPPPGLSALRLERPRPPQFNGVSALQDSAPHRTRRTSQQGLVARGNLYSRHINSGTFGVLPEKQPRHPAQTSTRGWSRSSRRLVPGRLGCTSPRWWKWARAVPAEPGSRSRVQTAWPDAQSKEARVATKKGCKRHPHPLFLEAVEAGQEVSSLCPLAQTQRWFHFTGVIPTPGRLPTLLIYIYPQVPEYIN
ncbi:alpha-tubulin N-acetyltransferase 1 isoform X2 [Amia ocellicauda]|uniref:alpha-tubulin N-acetyltransferase 1 isoform X2 n=1 Tax=Amia ocellicauda TaxID=2972642 RepID=UPI0034644399